LSVLICSFELIALIVICTYSLPACSQPQSCINKRLLCPSLASTLRNPILPKAVYKRKYVGLDEPNFDEDVEKRPDAGQEYDPDGDYIYDARKYFNPEKYREIIAHQEEKKKKQQESEKFYYKPLCRHGRHYHSRHNTGSGPFSANYADVRRDGLSLSASSPQHSEYCVHYGTLQQQNDDISSSKQHKKAKKKSKHLKHRSCSHSLNSCHKHSKRKKGDDKKHKKKRKRKKPDDANSTSLTDSYDDHTLSKKHRAKLRHRSRHRSRLFSSQEPSSRVTSITSCDFS